MFEKAIRFHQLAGICEKMRKLHKNDEETIEKIYAAEKLLLEGNINDAGAILLVSLLIILRD